MSIFFPDNNKRQRRVLELSSDAQNYLRSAKDKYKEFRKLNEDINERITAIYETGGLKPPEYHSVDILKSADASHDLNVAHTSVSVCKILVDVGGFILTTSYLAPAATSFLVDVGALSAETAGMMLGEVLGIEIILGSLIGGAIGMIMGTVIIIGIGMAVDAIEGSIMRDKLRNGINKLDQVRGSIKESVDKVTVLVDSLKALKTTLDTFDSASVKVTDKMMRNMISKSVNPSILKAKNINMNQVIEELKKRDFERGSWTAEDRMPHENQSPHNVFIIAKAHSNHHPSIPDGLKTSSLSSPDTLQSAYNYPVIKANGYTYWPLSYIDNRVGMAIVAYDHDGKLVKRWDKMGARYIVDINANNKTNSMVFRGQANQKISMSWKELAQLS